LDSKEELYVMAMQRLDKNWSFKDVTEASGIAYNTLKTYQGFWKKLSEKDFRIHVEGKKRGRQLFQPLSLLKMQDLNAEIIRNEDAQLVSSKQRSHESVIRPILIKEAEAAGKNAHAVVPRSQTAIARVVKAVLPCVSGQTKKSIKNRLAAKKSPFGGMSFVAMFPQLVAGIAQENWYFIDSVPVVLFDPSHLQKRAYMTKEVKNNLKETRTAPKAKDADGQRRGMKVNINMAWGPESLVGGTAIICDHAIPEIKKFAINAYTDVIFAPYCPADEIDEAAKAAAESLDARINFTLYADCVLPKVRGRIVRLMDWARSAGLDAELYRACRLFQDGEGGPLQTSYIILQPSLKMRKPFSSNFQMA
jgi:hypothetical protein